VTNESELRRQATAAGVFLDLPRTRPYSGEYPSTVPPSFQAVELTQPLTADETEQLLVWLNQWQEQPRERHEVAWCCRAFGHVVSADEVMNGWGHCSGRQCQEWSSVEQLPIVRSLLDPPAGFELVRHLWCPRCDRAAGDPLGRPVERIGWRGIEWTLASAKSGGHIGVPIVKPPAPEREIKPGCSRHRSTSWPHRAWELTWMGWQPPCGARRLYRWGLRRSYVDTCSIETRLSTEECVCVDDSIETRLSTEYVTPPSD
jgi:hypothetical protein